MAAIFKSLLSKMAATVMTVEFGTSYHYSSLKENSEACVCSSLKQIQQLNEHFVNCDILVKNNHVLNSNMNTN